VKVFNAFTNGVLGTFTKANTFDIEQPSKLEVGIVGRFLWQKESKDALTSLEISEESFRSKRLCNLLQRRRDNGFICGTIPNSDSAGFFALISNNAYNS
jgi:hypothetical protein